MELTAAGTPFIHFPLRNHFEQNFHAADRLDRYRAGRRMEFANSTPDMIAEAIVDALRAPARFELVAHDGAERAARMIAQLFRRVHHLTQVNPAIARLRPGNSVGCTGASTLFPSQNGPREFVFAIGVVQGGQGPL